MNPPKVEADDDVEMGLGDDDPTDADYGKTALHLTVLLFHFSLIWREIQIVHLQVRKSGRRARRASKAVLLELMRRRKRGRPPIITDPQACKFCGKVFIVLKDYKAHLVCKFWKFKITNARWRHRRTVRITRTN